VKAERLSTVSEIGLSLCDALDRKWQIAENEMLRSRIDSFSSFVFEIYSRSFENKFIGGKYLDDVCNFLESSKKTIRIAPRNHFKSSSLYAYFMYHLFTTRDSNLECHYFSYKDSMAAYHIKKIRSLIDNNEYFDGIRDCKQNAEGVLKYTWDNGHYVTLTPHGILGFVRGLHGDMFFVDDPFQDPEDIMKLNINTINKINERFVTNIMSMPDPISGELHVVGTPQTHDDFFFNKDITRRFNVQITPAIVSLPEKIVLWEEWMNWEEHVAKRAEMGERVYNQEYLCSPTHSEYSYFKRDVLSMCVNNMLTVEKSWNTRNDMILGWDIGKKAHPSHIVVFEKAGDRLIERYQIFMDEVDYTQQLNHVKSLWERFGITKGYYDDTRGELESFKEQEKLPYSLRGITFSQKSKFEMAAAFEKYVENQRIELIPDRRQFEQILLVDSDLNADETPSGHGDSFWSIALACKCAEDAGMKVKHTTLDLRGRARSLF